MKHAVLGLAAILATTSCGVPGRRSSDSPVISPAQVADFPLLYAQNCAGCHGPDGQGGLAVGLSDPVYLAIAGDATIRRVTAEGVPGTMMPAFAQEAGGLLTNAQIDIIVKAIRARWAKPGILGQAKPPAYATQARGDPKRGEGVYADFCSSCHGPGGRGGQRAGSIVDGSYLALVSNQHLRTIVIIGLPALGAPDWRSDVPGKPLSDDDVTDVVAWLAAQRPTFADHPYSSELNARGGPR
jgi:cytochrome c oxidase cbb3-type subunit III